MSASLALAEQPRERSRPRPGDILASNNRHFKNDSRAADEDTNGASLRAKVH